MGNLIFPPKCIFCSEILEHDAEIEICRKCFSRIPFIKDRQAFIKVFMQGTNPELTWFDGIFCLSEYKGIIKDAIMRYKYFGKSAYYRTFAKLMAGMLKTEPETYNFDMTIAVPLYKKKEMIRGYNQAQLISKELGKIMGIPDKSKLLVRLRNTGSQSLLRRDERYINVKDAFEVTDKKQVEGKTVLLVDDVLTTGHTLNECSKMLKKAGTVNVYCAVIAAASYI